MRRTPTNVEISDVRPVLGDRVLSIRQPWVDLILSGSKWVENRSRNIAGDYRGRIWLHAPQALDHAEIKRWHDEAGCDVASQSPYGMHTTAIVGRVDLVGVLFVDDLKVFIAGGPAASQVEKVLGPEVTKGLRGMIALRPDSVGYVQGEHCLLLANPEPCQPIPCGGKLGLWKWSENR